MVCSQLPTICLQAAIKRVVEEEKDGIFELVVVSFTSKTSTQGETQPLVSLSHPFGKRLYLIRRVSGGLVASRSGRMMAIAVTTPHVGSVSCKSHHSAFEQHLLCGQQPCQVNKPLIKY